MCKDAERDICVSNYGSAEDCKSISCSLEIIVKVIIKVIIVVEGLIIGGIIPSRWVKQTDSFRLALYLA